MSCDNVQEENRNTESLLIIDMQVGLFTDETPRFDAKNVIIRINRLSAFIRKKKGKVIFIQNDDAKGEYMEPGTPPWEILPQLDQQDDDIIIRKTVCDAFFKTELAETLHRLQTDQLVITGCATDFCVDTTIRSAVNKEFNLIVAEDAHTTADRPHLDAEAIIQHHNWMWTNMLVPGNKIRVEKTESIINSL